MGKAACASIEVPTVPFAWEAVLPRRLLVFWDGGSVTVPLVHDQRVVLGRAADCDVRVLHPSISRRHVALYASRRGVEVEDLDSSLGVRLRGAFLVPRVRVPVTVGEIVEIGPAFFVVRNARGPEATLEAPAPSTMPAARTIPPPRSALPADIIVADPAMQQLHEFAALVGQGDLNVLLLGETGVGKEVMAATIHRHSRQAKGPLVALNCAALPEALLEAELFGCERGAFTGAASARAGLVEAANGGTLFLDEIGEMPPAAQAKLLRVIEHREVMRVGSTKPRRVDVRFVSATHRDIKALSAAGSFRQDLYFRLNGLSLSIPPLRERPAEIRILARRFASDAARRMTRPELALADETLSTLERYSWPGNVRELKNVIDRAVLLCTGPAILPAHLGLADGHGAPAPAVEIQPRAGDADGSERQRILQALEECGGNQSRAARRLGIARNTLLRRLDEYAVIRPRKRG